MLFGEKDPNTAANAFQYLKKHIQAMDSSAQQEAVALRLNSFFNIVNCPELFEKMEDNYTRVGLAYVVGIPIKGFNEALLGKKYVGPNYERLKRIDPIQALYNNTLLGKRNKGEDAQDADVEKKIKTEDTSSANNLPSKFS